MIHPYITEPILDQRRRELLAAAEASQLAARTRAREHRSLRGRLATAVRGLATRPPRHAALEPCADGDCA